MRDGGQAQVCRETHLGSRDCQGVRHYCFFLLVSTVDVFLRRSAFFTEMNRPVFASRPILVGVSFFSAILLSPQSIMRYPTRPYDPSQHEAFTQNCIQKIERWSLV